MPAGIAPEKAHFPHQLDDWGGLILSGFLGSLRSGWCSLSCISLTQVQHSLHHSVTQPSTARASTMPHASCAMLQPVVSLRPQFINMGYLCCLSQHFLYKASLDTSLDSDSQASHQLCDHSPASFSNLSVLPCSPMWNGDDNNILSDDIEKGYELMYVKFWE